MKLDHIMFAVRDLDAGIEEIQRLTGTRPENGGSHEGAGTRNALLSFGNNQYLEIIAPDPAQEIAGTLGEELSLLEKSLVRTWAVATTGFETIIPALDRYGFGHRVIDMSRTRPDGVHLAWQILFVTRAPFGLAMPFFIDWLGSPHPADVAPGGCELKAFSVQCPGADAFHAFCSDIGLEVAVSEGTFNLSALIRTPSGEVSLT